MTDVVIVYAEDDDHIGNGIWGVFSTYKKAVKALKAAGLRVWDPDAHNAGDPDNETPREADERVIGAMTMDYRLRKEVTHDRRTTKPTARRAAQS